MRDQNWKPFFILYANPSALESKGGARARPKSRTFPCSNLGSHWSAGGYARAWLPGSHNLFFFLFLISNTTEAKVLYTYLYLLILS